MERAASLRVPGSLAGKRVGLVGSRGVRVAGAVLMGGSVDSVSDTSNGTQWAWKEERVSEEMKPESRALWF